MPDQFPAGQFPAGHFPEAHFVGESFGPPGISAAWGPAGVTVTIRGAEGADHNLLYAPVDREDWLNGGTRNGDGDIVLSGLDHGKYRFVAYSELDGRTSRPSNLAERYVPGSGECTFSTLRALVVADCAALQDSNGQTLFEAVGTWMLPPRTLKCPAAVVRPVNDPDAIDGITNISTFTDYRFAIGFAIKGIRDEDLIDRALVYRSVLKEWFESAADYSAVAGFVSVRIENNALSVEDGDGPAGALLFGSGITVVVQMMRETY